MYSIKLSLHKPGFSIQDGKRHLPVVTDNLRFLFVEANIIWYMFEWCVGKRKILDNTVIDFSNCMNTNNVVLMTFYQNV